MKGCTSRLVWRETTRPSSRGDGYAAEPGEVAGHQAGHLGGHVVVPQARQMPREQPGGDPVRLLGDGLFPSPPDRRSSARARGWQVGARSQVRDVVVKASLSRT